MHVNLYVMKMCVQLALMSERLDMMRRSQQDRLVLNLVAYSLEECSSSICMVPKQRQGRNTCVKKAQLVFGGRESLLDLSKVTRFKLDDSEVMLMNKWWEIFMDETTGKK